MVDHYENRTEIIHEINAIFRHAVMSVSAPRPWPARFQENRANLASRHEDCGFRGPGARPFADTTSGSLHNGDLANRSYEKEKSVSVDRLQVFKAYWAYALCVMPRALDRPSVSVFAHHNDDTHRVYASGLRRTPKAKLSD